MGLTEIHYRIIGFEYSDAETAKAVFDKATAELKDCSIWRTATPDLSRWFILALLAENFNDQKFDWGGKRFSPSPEQREWMIKRRLARGIIAVITNEGTVSEKRHYEPESAPRIPDR